MDIIEDFRANVLDVVHKEIVNDTVHQRKIINRWLSIPNMYQIVEGNPVAIHTDHNWLINIYPLLKVKIILITHPEMKSVWKSIDKRINKLPDDPDAEVTKLSEYIDHIYSAVTDRSYWETVKPTQRDKEYDELIFNLKEIATRLNKFGYSDSVAEIASSRRFIQFYDKSGTSSNELTPAIFDFDFVKIPDLLNVYADILLIEERQKDVLIDRPNGNDATVSLFARSLYLSHMKQFNTPLYGTISTIAGIFYPDNDTSLEKIRASIRSMK